jgi:sugar phosphate isomerase/epimerase
MMKLGYLSSIVPEFSFEQVIDFAAENGFKCVEMASWPVGKATRRYAGVTHINTDELDDAKVEYIKNYCKEKGVEISGIAYYPNPLHEDPEVRKVAIDHIKECIVAADKLEIYQVNTFIGRNRKADPEQNWEEFMQVWPDIIHFAEEHKVRIGIENCPMFFWDEWPNGDNLACSPAFWEKMFEAIPSDYFGLNYDPSHLVYQRMDYLNVAVEFKDKLFHFHAKDAKFYQDKYDRVGMFARPLLYHAPKLPGQGDVNWGKMMAALNDAGYKGAFIIEVEDRAYEDTLEDRLESILLSRDYLRQFIR